MKRLAILNSEGNIIECRINKYSEISVKVLLLKDQGSILFTPKTSDISKYLLGECTLNRIIRFSKDIIINDKRVDAVNVDYNNIHSGKKKITELCKSMLCMENIEMLVAQLEVRNNIIKNKRNMPRRHDNPSIKRRNDFVPNKRTYMEINEIVQSISEMNTLGMVSLLNEDALYGGMVMYKFMSLVHNKFEDFKKNGDTILLVNLGNCNGCLSGSKNDSGFSFVGNVSGKKWSLMFLIEDRELVDIFECHNFKQHNPNELPF